MLHELIIGENANGFDERCIFFLLKLLRSISELKVGSNVLKIFTEYFMKTEHLFSFLQTFPVSYEKIAIK